MSITDLRCDLCGRLLPMPSAGVRFVYHPGVPALRDDQSLACLACWDQITSGLDTTAVARCARCGAPAPRQRSLHVRRFDQTGTWRLCGPDAVDFLNALLTVQPKLDRQTFRFPGDGQGPGSQQAGDQGSGDELTDDEAPGQSGSASAG